MLAVAAVVVLAVGEVVVLAVGEVVCASCSWGGLC